jgi:hypothetical protein
MGVLLGAPKIGESARRLTTAFGTTVELTSTHLLLRRRG